MLREAFVFYLHQENKKTEENFLGTDKENTCAKFLRKINPA